MANDLTGNPYICDTTGTVLSTPARVKKFVYTPTTDGDDLVVQDNAGNNVWKFKAIGAATDQSIFYENVIDGPVNGISINTIDNGTLYIYLK